MNKSTQDAGIPILTEIIEPPRVDHAPAEETTIENQAAPVAPVIPAASSQTGHAPINGWLDEEWTRLEQKISERMLTQLIDRIEPILEQQLRDSLAASLEATMADIRSGLHHTMEQLVRNAVAQEIDELQFKEK